MGADDRRLARRIPRPSASPTPRFAPVINVVMAASFGCNGTRTEVQLVLRAGRNGKGATGTPSSISLRASSGFASP